MALDNSRDRTLLTSSHAYPHRVLVADDRDNVANALGALAEGDRVEALGRSIAVCTPVPLGHKIALASIAAGTPIVKYGEVIGQASVDIAAGEHVHTHNVASMFGELLSVRGTPAGRRW